MVVDRSSSAACRWSSCLGPAAQQHGSLFQVLPFSRKHAFWASAFCGSAKGLAFAQFSSAVQFDPMATSHGPAPSHADQLIRALSCEVCLELFSADSESRRPRILTCGHSFCHACISEVLGGGGFPIPVTSAPKVCPACRAPVPTGVSAVELPRNFALEHAARVVFGMGSDVWMAAALVADGTVPPVPPAPPSMLWPARLLQPRADPDPDPQPTAPPDAGVLGSSASAPPCVPHIPLRSRPSKAVPSRSALALAASGVPAPAVVAGITRLVLAHGAPLSLSTLCDRMAAEDPRLWPPIGFLPRYYGQRCLAVPAAALARPDAALLRAFVLWATSPEAAVAAAAGGAGQPRGRVAGVAAVAVAAVRGAEALHLERTRHGSLAEVVCAGGPGCSGGSSRGGGRGLGSSDPMVSGGRPLADACNTPLLPPSAGKYVPPSLRQRTVGTVSGDVGGGGKGAAAAVLLARPRRYHADSTQDDDDLGGASDGSGNDWGRGGYESWDDARGRAVGRRGRSLTARNWRLLWGAKIW